MDSEPRKCNLVSNSFSLFQPVLRYAYNLQHIFLKDDSFVEYLNAFLLLPVSSVLIISATDTKYNFILHPLTICQLKHRSFHLPSFSVDICKSGIL